MNAVWAGAVAFLIASCFDLANMAGMMHLKRAIVVLAGILFLLAFWQVLVQPPAFELPRWVIPIGTLLTVLGLALSAYSLVIEIPVQATYVSPDASSQLVTTGTYALCRHPGVLWFALLLLGSFITHRSLTMFIAALVWLGLDILYVWLQDRFFFPKQFPDYPAYRQHTPMLIPTRASIRRCWQTLPWPRGRSPERGQPHHPLSK
jgi:protein-S-isoprenylcysteine O-methyltransferase Ste14